MDKTQKINEILGINDSYKAPTKLMEILFNKQKREEIFYQFLELFHWKMEHDWFHEYFQEEHSDRKTKKQDFTPMSVADVINQTVNEEGMYHESCAGTGGIAISHWHKTRLKYHPLTYKPSDHLYMLEELSDRALPFLIFNMAIRGVNATIIHCDVLSRDCFGVFFIQNDKNLSLEFSNINVMPYSKDASEAFNVKFFEEKYPAHIESPKEIFSQWENLWIC